MTEIAKEKKGHQTFDEVFEHFWNHTSIEGLPNTVKSRTRHTKFLWGIATLACACMLVWQLTELLIKYFTYLIAINAYIEYVSPDFPHVTVCNNYPFDAMTSYDISYAQYLAELAQLKAEVGASSPIAFDTDKQFWSDVQSRRSFMASQPHFTGTPPLSVNETFITDCSWFTWNWSPLSNSPAALCKEFVTTRWDANYYSCYTLTPPEPGLMGFSLILYVDNFPPFTINSSTVNIGITITEGVRLYVHSPNTYPLMLQAGVNVSPGTEVTVRLAEILETHLGEPYSSCTTQPLLDPRDPTYIYSQAACLTVCRQKQYLEACQCAVEYEGFTWPQLSEYNATFCAALLLNPNNETDLMKVIQYSKCSEYFWAQNIFCDCLPPCEEEVFHQTVTVVKWPDSTNQLAFYDKYIKNNPIYGTKFDAYKDLEARLGNMNTSAIVAEIESINLIPMNFIQLNFQMSTQITTVHEDMPAVTWDTLFSNLGGTLHLWLGITAMFAAEVGELLINIVAVHCTRGGRKPPPEEREGGDGREDGGKDRRSIEESGFDEKGGQSCVNEGFDYDEVPLKIRSKAKRNGGENDDGSVQETVIDVGGLKEDEGDTAGNSAGKIERGGSMKEVEVDGECVVIAMSAEKMKEGKEGLRHRYMGGGVEIGTVREEGEQDEQDGEGGRYRLTEDWTSIDKITEEREGKQAEDAGAVEGADNGGLDEDEAGEEMDENEKEEEAKEGAVTKEWRRRTPGIDTVTDQQEQEIQEERGNIAGIHSLRELWEEQDRMRERQIEGYTVNEGGEIERERNEGEGNDGEAEDREVQEKGIHQEVENEIFG